MARVAFMGSKEAGLRILERMVTLVQPPHQLVGVLSPNDTSDHRSVLPGLCELSLAQGVPFVTVESGSQADAVLQEWAPDLVIVCGWYLLIRLERFAGAKFYGFHFSPLPRYRGNAPLVWQIIQGEREIGASFFEFAPGLDEGDIVAQVRLPFGENETIQEALERLQAGSLEMLTQHLPALLDGTATLTKQDHAQATFCGLRTPEDGRINWNWSARRVHDFIRAQTRPYPGAFSALPDGRTVRFWRSEVDPRPYIGVPGAVAERTRECVILTCGEGALKIYEAQVDGEPLEPVGAIFNSLRLRMG